MIDSCDIIILKTETERAVVQKNNCKQYFYLSNLAMITDHFGIKYQMYLKKCTHLYYTPTSFALSNPYQLNHLTLFSFLRTDYLKTNIHMNQELNKLMLTICVRYLSGPQHVFLLVPALLHYVSEHGIRNNQKQTVSDRRVGGFEESKAVYTHGLVALQLLVKLKRFDFPIAIVQSIIPMTTLFWKCAYISIQYEFCFISM